MCIEKLLRMEFDEILTFIQRLADSPLDADFMEKFVRDGLLGYLGDFSDAYLRKIALRTANAPNPLQ